MARRVERFEFTPDEATRVIGYMDELALAGDGWINLLPGISGREEEEPIIPTGLAALFGSRQQPTTMCTWVAPTRSRRGLRPATIGILHPRGRRVVLQLASLDTPVPEGWRVTQDHVRRGLVVQPADGAPQASVLDWTLRAGAVLCAETLSGTWQASVHLPSVRA
jgi:hypothetical protein